KNQLGGKRMSIISMKQLLEAGVHFGHQTRRWNPKMKKYIFTERNGIYIIDLQKTVKKVEEAYNFVKDIAANDGSILFVGTKKQIRRKKNVNYFNETIVRSWCTFWSPDTPLESKNEKVYFYRAQWYIHH